MGLKWIRENDLHCPYCNHEHGDELDMYLYKSKNEHALHYPCDNCKLAFAIRPTNLGFIKLYKTRGNKNK